MALLTSATIFLGATLIAVPLFKRFKLGAILGYLIAGVLIGPAIFNLVGDPYTILHFAEIGVVLLLFVIGLELEPSTLWRMRNMILLSGGSQLVLSTVAITLLCFFVLGLSYPQSITIGLALALSSTAFAIQLMNEQHILNTPPGQQGFSVLLMQDVAVIPILLIVAALSPEPTTEGVAWYVSVAAIIAVLVSGKFLVNPLLRIVARYGSGEVMTAAALFLVLVTALAMQAVGLSMGMGAFIAGILLANSSFKHQLEAEIEPFKGLLLGLFFIAIGMNLDLSLLMNEPIFIIGMSLLLILVKTLILVAILVLNKQSKKDATRIALMLSQGGEFAFVVMTLAVSSSVLPEDIASRVNLIVGLSMALTSPMVIIYAKYFSSKDCPPVYESDAVNHEPEVIIAGFGRFGQITARILNANNIPFTALDKDAEHIEFVKKFGNKVFFGDATRLELLKKAGMEHAKTLLVAVDEKEQINALVHTAKQHFPTVKIIARATDRNHAVELAKDGVQCHIREVFTSGVEAGRAVLESQGYTQARIEQMTTLFIQHDHKLLQDVIDNDYSHDEWVDKAQQGRKELQSLFNDDKTIS